jgi:hypothetical protein
MGFKDEDGLFPWTEGQMNDGEEIVKHKIMSGDDVERYMVDVVRTGVCVCVNEFSRALRAFQIRSESLELLTYNFCVLI